MSKQDGFWSNFLRSSIKRSNRQPTRSPSSSTLSSQDFEDRDEVIERTETTSITIYTSNVDVPNPARQVIIKTGPIILFGETDRNRFVQDITRNALQMGHGFDQNEIAHQNRNQRRLSRCKSENDLSEMPSFLNLSRDDLKANLTNKGEKEDVEGAEKVAETTSDKNRFRTQNRKETRIEMGNGCQAMVTVTKSQSKVIRRDSKNEWLSKKIHKKCISPVRIFFTILSIALTVILLYVLIVYAKLPS